MEIDGDGEREGWRDGGMEGGGQGEIGTTNGTKGTNGSGGEGGGADAPEIEDGRWGSALNFEGGSRTGRGVCLGWVGIRRVGGVCLRCASSFGQPVAGYLPSVGSRSDDGHFRGMAEGWGGLLGEWGSGGCRVVVRNHTGLRGGGWGKLVDCTAGDALV
jgi:hypothetical protein